MALSRREFAIGTTSLVTLTILGCKGEEPPAGAGLPRKIEKAELPAEPFLVGEPAQYKTPGVYEQFNISHRTWLMSNGKTLIAYMDECTHLSCQLAWKMEDNLFHCPCHESRFDAAGKPQEGSNAKRPLERFAIAIIDTPEGKQVQIDPTVALREDDGGWDDPRASCAL